MTNFIPIFPLQIVLYPGEPLNLHIFEPRYRQLVADCLEGQKPFGIPVARGEQPLEMGTLVRIKEVVKTYENGNLDIRTEGEAVFEILTLVRDIPEKQYSGAIVNYPPNELRRADSTISDVIYREVKRLFALLQVEDRLAASGTDLNAYQIAHLVGLRFEQEYELLHILEETQRLEYLRRHLKEIAPLVGQLEALKERVKRNGHFRNLKWDGRF